MKACAFERVAIMLPHEPLSISPSFQVVSAELTATMWCGSMLAYIINSTYGVEL
jgi:hypothetical protein